MNLKNKKRLSVVAILCFITSSFSCYAANWTQEDGDYYYIPKFSALKTGDLTNFKVRITDKNPYATTGIFLKNSQLNPKNSHVVAKTDTGTRVNVQFDAQNFYPNGSVRFALVTVEKPQNSDSEFEVILSSSFDEKPRTKVTPLKPNFTVMINRAEQAQKSVTLVDATPEEKPWRSGHLVDIRRYYAPVTPDLMVEFDVTTFANGMVGTDIVMRYDRLYNTPMKSITYDATVLYNNKSYKELKNIKQNHHSKFRIPVKFGYKSDNITALNMSRIMDTRALARYDVTYGVDTETIEQDYQNFKTANNSIQGSSLINPSFPDTGTRDDIALLPQWTARYLLTSHDKSREVVLAQGDIAAYIPWHFVDEKTNNAPLPHQHPKLYFDYRANMENNHIMPYTTEGTIWTLDIAHQPSLSYIPYLITGDRYYYDNLVAAYSWSRFALINAPDWGILRDPMLRTQNFDQQRAYGWLQRVTAETALVTPDNTPLAHHLKKQMTADVTYFQKGHIDGLEYQYDKTKHGNPTGELRGMLHGFGSDSGRENPLFMQNLAAIGMGFHAGSGVNDGMKTISAFQTDFISGIFLQKNNGYPPEYGTAYKILQYIPDDKNGIETLMGKIGILNRWSDVFKYSIDSGYFKEIEATKDVQAGGLPGYYTAAGLFVGYSRAAQSMLFNVTKNAKSLEAYGFLAQYLPAAFDDYHKNPAYMIVPEIGHGYLTYKRTFIGDDGDDTMVAESHYNLLHGRSGNDVLSLKNFSGVAFGGDNDDFLTAGSQDSFLYGGSGEDILTSGLGNDYLKGDEDYGKEKDIFVFTKPNFGRDVIADFTPDIDKIQLAPRTGIKTYSYDNKVYGTRIDKKDDTNAFRKSVTPDIPKDLSPVERQKQIDLLLSQSSRGDIKAKKKLNIQSQINIGVQNYMRPDGNGGTYIDLNTNRTPEEKQIASQNPAFEQYGVIHLLNVPMDKLRASDFIFKE